MSSAALTAWTWVSCLRSPLVGLALSAALPLACSVYTQELVDDDASGVTGGANAGRSGASTGTGAGGKSSVVANGGQKQGGTGSMTTGGTGFVPDGQAGEGGSVPGSSGSGSGGADTQAGSSTGGSAAGTAGGGAGGSPVGLPGDLVDGFEDEDLTLEQTAGRGGVWYLFDDGSVGKAGPTPLACSPLTGVPAPLGLYGMHITATGFTVWGSGLGVDFRAGKKPYDGSKYSGIRYWARVGAGKNAKHRLQIADGTTEKVGGKCDPALDAIDGEKCEDHFGINQTFTTSWTQYSVTFAELSQIGWGNSAPALDRSTLYGLQLTAKAKLEVDLWLDQIEFF